MRYKLILFYICSVSVNVVNGKNVDMAYFSKSITLFPKERAEVLFVLNEGDDCTNKVYASHFDSNKTENVYFYYYLGSTSSDCVVRFNKKYLYAAEDATKQIRYRFVFPDSLKIIINKLPDIIVSKDAAKNYALKYFEAHDQGNDPIVTHVSDNIFGYEVFLNYLNESGSEYYKYCYSSYLVNYVTGVVSPKSKRRCSWETPSY